MTENTSDLKFFTNKENDTLHARYYQLILEGTEYTFRITALNFFRDIEKGILK